MAEYGQEMEARRQFVKFWKAGGTIPNDVLDVVCEILEKDLEDYDSRKDKKAALERKIAKKQETEQEQILYLRHIIELMALGMTSTKARIRINRSNEKTDRQYQGRAFKKFMNKNGEYENIYYDPDSNQDIIDTFFQSGLKFTLDMEPPSLNPIRDGVFEMTMLPPDQMVPHPDIQECVVTPLDPIWVDCQPFIDLLGYKFIKPFEVTIQVSKANPNSLLAVQSARFRK